MMEEADMTYRMES